MAASAAHSSHAQTVLFQCNFDGPGTTAEDRWKQCGGTSSDGFHAYSSLASGPVGMAASVDEPQWTPIDAVITPQREVTIVYYERFSTWPGGTARNTKSIRPFHENDGYQAAFSGDFYGRLGMSWWDDGILVPTSMVTGVDTNPDYCQPRGDGTYRCRGADGVGRLAITWTPGYGTDWTKVRLYIRMPSTDTSTDGRIEMWMNEQLLFTLRDVLKSGGARTTRHITWYPSEASATPYKHYLDEVIVYQGYVPPSGGGNSPPGDVRGLNRSDTK